MSWKKTPPTLLMRLRRGRASGAAAFAVAFGLLTGGASLWGALDKLGGWAISGGLVLVIAVGVGIAWLRGRATLLPDRFIDELSDEPAYQAAYCTTEQLREACDMTKPHYGNEYVPADIAEQWRLKNPQGFVSITNPVGELCACFGLLALSPSFTDIFYQGQCTDTTLRAANILNPDEAKRSARLYLSGVVVRDAHTHMGHKRARVMLWAVMKFYRDCFGLRREKTLFGLAVTPESERLLKTLEFNLASERAGRLDRCNLYELKMTKPAWERVAKRVGDLSGMCTVDWSVDGAHRMG